MRMMEVMAQEETINHPRGDHNDGRLEQVIRRIKGVEEMLSNPTGKLECLTNSVLRLENKLDMGGVQLGNFQFGCMDDLLIF